MRGLATSLVILFRPRRPSLNVDVLWVCPRSVSNCEVTMGSVIKKRRKRMAKKKHRKLLRKTRHQRRNKK